MAKFEDIIQGNTLVFVDFFATWCGPCKMMHPVLEGLKKQLGERVKIVKIDIDSPVNRQLVNSYQVQAVPTLMLFKAGKMVWRQRGDASNTNSSSD
ncbi:MAG: thioredoxin family protein [Odoribacter splanchnicus]